MPTRTSDPTTSPSSSDLPAAIGDRLRREAERLGFDAVGIAAIDKLPDYGQGLLAFVAEGRHGDMAWLADSANRRSRPQALWPEARSAVMLAVRYPVERDPLEALADWDRGTIALYAKRRDYHDVVKGRLKHLAQWLARKSLAER